MKYEVGTMVKIRSDLVVGKLYGDVEWLDFMQDGLAGEIVELTMSLGGAEYTVDDEYSRGYCISDDMIECKYESCKWCGKEIDEQGDICPFCGYDEDGLDEDGCDHDGVSAGMDEQADNMRKDG